MRLKTEDPREIIQALSAFYQSVPIHNFFHSAARDRFQGQPALRFGIDAGGHRSSVEGAAARLPELDRFSRLKSISDAEAGYPSGLTLLTNSGIYVRSKSERTIADALDQYEIPYLYEAKLSLGNLIRYPDFTINRPFDGELVLWEHFGRMDNVEYRKAANEKIALYGEYGFFPSENLICTFERDLLDPGRLHTIIELYLLR